MNIVQNLLITIKEAGIFVILAEVLLYMVPEARYEKYMKILIGVTLVIKLASPVYLLLQGDSLEQELKAVYQTQQNSLLEETENMEDRASEGMLVRVEGEIMQKLKGKECPGTRVKTVRLYMKEDSFQSLQIGLSMEQNTNTDEVRMYYATLLDMPEDQIEIVDAG